MKENTNKNALVVYRNRMSLSQKRVASLLGYRDAARLSHYERGDMLPSLKDAFGLGIVLRVPVEFLFPDLYEELRNRLREREENSGSQPREGTLQERRS